MYTQNRCTVLMTNGKVNFTSGFLPFLVLVRGMVEICTYILTRVCVNRSYKRENEGYIWFKIMEKKTYFTFVYAAVFYKFTSLALFFHPFKLLFDVPRKFSQALPIG